MEPPVKVKIFWVDSKFVLPRRTRRARRVVYKHHFVNNSMKVFFLQRIVYLSLFLNRIVFFVLFVVSLA
jgi:hypothetical protein